MDVEDVHGLHEAGPAQAATALLEAYEDLKPQDLAEAMHDLSPKRRAEVADALDDETLADVMEELPDDDRLQILTHLPTDRAADILEVMQPDDATDLLADLPEETQEELLQLMEPDEASPVRALLSYSPGTAGSLMTSEPVVMTPDATVAEALARVRDQQLSPAVAAQVFVTRAPTATPTGRFLGVVHFQRLLREPPAAMLGGLVDKGIDPLEPTTPVAEITKRLATYNLVAMAVVGAALPGFLPGVGWSDQWAFWQHGYHAVMVTDTAPFRYPHYHTAGDTPDKLDYDRLTRVVRGLAETIAELAG